MKSHHNVFTHVQVAHVFVNDRPLWGVITGGGMPAELPVAFLNNPDCSTTITNVPMDYPNRLN